MVTNVLLLMLILAARAARCSSRCNSFHVSFVELLKMFFSFVSHDTVSDLCLV